MSNRFKTYKWQRRAAFAYIQMWAYEQIQATEYQRGKSKLLTIECRNSHQLDMMEEYCFDHSLNHKCHPEFNEITIKRPK